jgi:cytochrome c oxidase assembly protein subunit 20
VPYQSSHADSVISHAVAAMAQDSNGPEPPKGWKRLYVWSRPVDDPNASPAKSAAQASASDEAAAAASQSPQDKKPPKNLNPVDFHANFPEQRPVERTSLVEAAKTIKGEDFLNIAQVPCARQGLITGIASGAAIGGLRWVWIGRLRFAVSISDRSAHRN